MAAKTMKAAAAAPAVSTQVLPTPNWSCAMRPGPDSSVKITEAYARHIAKDAFFWTWPMVNVYTRRLVFSQYKKVVMAGPLPTPPLNQIAMLTDYVNPEERAVACPNQDVVYGVGLLALDLAPIVVQVPDFGDRFWVYQIVDCRTDSFVELGKMYGTTPGSYLLVGPNWSGEVPSGITRVFRCPTNTAIGRTPHFPGRHAGR